MAARAFLLALLTLIRRLFEAVGWSLAIFLVLAWTEYTREPGVAIVIGVFLGACFVVGLFTLLQHVEFRRGITPKERKRAREKAKAAAADEQARQPLPEKPKSAPPPGGRPRVAPWGS